MEYIPIRTRLVTPPKDDLFSLLEEYLSDVRERDIVLISSKIIAICEGRCVPIESTQKVELVRQEADFLIPAKYYPTTLTVKYHTFLGAAGIDESNGNGYYVLLPEDIFKSASLIHEYLCNRYHIHELGIIITDSRSQPFRLGAIGVALGYWGIAPLVDHVGKHDLFGREIQYERSNVVDGIATGACVVSGEVAEQIPIVIARDVPQLTFIHGNQKDALMVDPANDLFHVLYERFI